MEMIDKKFQEFLDSGLFEQERFARYRIVHLKETKFYLSKLSNPITWYIMAEDGLFKIEFKEVFECVPETIQKELIYYLDII